MYDNDNADDDDDGDDDDDDEEDAADDDVEDDEKDDNVAEDEVEEEDVAEDEVEDDEVEEDDDIENDDDGEDEDDDVGDDDVEEGDRSQDLGPHFAWACTVEMHVNMSQEPLFTEIYRKNAAPQIEPRTRTHTLFEPAQSQCMWWFHKSHFIRKFTGKMPRPSVSTLMKHRPLLLP